VAEPRPNSCRAAPRSRAFLTRKWGQRELDYRLIKEVWAFRDKPHCGALRLRVARRQRPLVSASYGNENWEFRRTRSDGGLRIASINDLPIADSERKYHWPIGRRPDDHPSLSDPRPVEPDRTR